MCVAAYSYNPRNPQVSPDLSVICYLLLVFFQTPVNARVLVL